MAATTSISTSPSEWEGESIEWINRPTCFLSTAAQTGKLWQRLRIGTISMSMLSKCVGRSNPAFTESPSELAAQICGLSSKSFDYKSLDRMQTGIQGEPILRDWYAREIGKSIAEVGVGVWKENPIFRGSMDGEIEGTTEFVELKIPHTMYRKLIEHCEAIKKGYTPAPGEHAHIFDSHYDQMMGNAIINGKTACHYVVCSAETSIVYYQVLPVNRDHWEKVLYPGAMAFYSTYVEPLMRKHGVQRIDPPSKGEDKK